MLVKKNLNEQEILKLYQKFSKKYKSLYSDEAWEYIENNFWTYVFSSDAPDILMQIYTELGFEYDGGSYYKRHLENLKEKFDIGCNVLDIASGMIPSFANQLAHEQIKLKRGTVTLYEPLLITTDKKYRNMTLHKEKFSKEISIKDFDLLTGIMPCQATELIIEQACLNQKDFYIAMCGCTHFDYIPWGMYVTPEMYQDHVIEKTKRLLEENDNGTLVIERFENFPIDYPILYNRKK